MRRCIIFAATPDWTPLSDLCSDIKPTKDDFIIACDGGIKHAMNENIQPDVCMGDFDSFTGELPDKIIASGAKVIRAKPEKDDTDLMLAVKYAFQQGITNIVLLGVTGGRADHTFAAYQTALWIAKNNGVCTIADKNSIYYTLTNKNSPFSVPQINKKYVSVFTLTDKSTGVFEKDFKYPLNNATLTSDFPLGVSNEITGNNPEISVNDGVLLVILT